MLHSIGFYSIWKRRKTNFFPLTSPRGKHKKVHNEHICKMQTAVDKYAQQLYSTQFTFYLNLSIRIYVHCAHIRWMIFDLCFSFFLCRVFVCRSGRRCRCRCCRSSDELKITRTTKTAIMQCKSTYRPSKSQCSSQNSEAKTISLCCGFFFSVYL